MSGLGSGGNISCVFLASWRQLDGFFWVGKPVGEEKKGGCVARGGKAVYCLKKSPRMGQWTRAGWRMEVGSGIVLFLSLKAAEMLLTGLRRTNEEQRWLWEGSSFGERVGGMNGTGSCRPGDKPCLGSEKLAQTETGTATT